MADVSYLGKWARRCRALAELTTDHDVSYQLQAWAIEFDQDADAASAELGQSEVPSGIDPEAGAMMASVAEIPFAGSRTQLCSRRTEVFGAPFSAILTVVTLTNDGG